MNEDWLNNIHNRMANYEADEPCGLWDNIQNSMSAQNTDAPTASRKHTASTLWLRAKRIASVAALVAAIVSISLFIITDNTNVNLQQNNTLADNNPPQSEPSPHNSAPTIESINSNKAASPLILPNNTSSHLSSSTTTESDNTIAQSDASPSDSQLQSIPKSIEQSKQQTSTRHNATSNYTPSPYRDYHIAKAQGSRLSVGIFTNGGTGTSSATKSSGASYFSAIGADRSGWNDSPMLGILLYNQGSETEKEIKHRLPIRAGVSVAYALNNRLSIESGLTYTNLSSDYREGSENHYIEGVQTMHYIGLPVNLKYKALTWRHFDFYLSAGGMIEKCVASSETKNYIINQQPSTTGKADIDEKPLQWSVNAAAGVQFNINTLAGIYVEPGINYYFNDGSDIKNIYSDKPLNFSINIGLRFTLDHK